jgi:hypothetical protein
LDVAQQIPIFWVEGSATSAKKGGLITFVTVMSDRCLIPSETILSREVLSARCMILFCLMDNPSIH